MTRSRPRADIIGTLSCHHAVKMPASRSYNNQNALRSVGALLVFRMCTPSDVSLIR